MNVLSKRKRDAMLVFFFACLLLFSALGLSVFFCPDYTKQIAAFGIIPISILFGMYLGLLMAEDTAKKEAVK